MMKNATASLLCVVFCVCILSISNAKKPALLSSLSSNSIFGVARGGGLFGDKKGKSETTTDTTTTTTASDKKLYPPLTTEEIEEWLSHIPVYAVTDSNGAGVVLKPDNETSVFYFFISPQMANATLQQLNGVNEGLNLRVSAFSLGKIWFRILTADKKDVEVQLKDPATADSPTTTTTGVEYRLVPDTRDLLGARMLLTMDPADGEKLKNGGEFSAEMANNAIQKAMTSSPKFNSTYNEIPVFMIQQMRMQKQPATPEEEGKKDEEPLTLLPMYFNLQNMVNIWQQFITQQAGDVQNVEPAISLMDLFDLVGKMQEESEIDFRSVVLVPPVPNTPGSGAAAVAGEGSDGLQLPGSSEATLGDV